MNFVFLMLFTCFFKGKVKAADLAVVAAAEVAVKEEEHWLVASLKPDLPSNIRQFFIHAINHLTHFHHRDLRYADDLKGPVYMGGWVLSHYLKTTPKEDRYNTKVKGFLLADAFHYLCERGCLLPCEKEFVNKFLLAGVICSECWDRLEAKRDELPADHPAKNSCNGEALVTLANEKFGDDPLYCDQCIKLLSDNFELLRSAVTKDIATLKAAMGGSKTAEGESSEVNSILLTGKSNQVTHVEEASDDEYELLQGDLAKLSLDGCCLTNSDFVGVVVSSEEMQ